jgi:membrane-bound transcription factor site-1 protease
MRWEYAFVAALLACSLPLFDLTETSVRTIVRFNGYHDITRLHQYVEDILDVNECSGKVSWVARDNLARFHPTDFAVVESAYDGTVLTNTCFSCENKWNMEFCRILRDTHPDRSLVRSPQWAVVSGETSLASGAEIPRVEKAPGRMRTRSSFDIEETRGDARSLKAGTTELVDRLQPQFVWEKGYSGSGIKMGVFDTGIKENHPDVEHVEERSNWTHEPSLSDGLGHGSFVAGVIASKNPRCPGLAPNVSIHTFKVFTNDQVSFTSWFLDAFNYAMATEMDIVNLSIGGPDYLDMPFVDKVMEVTSSGIIMTSAIGNDGPTYGTMNNPADQNDVIGVGGITYKNELAGFSSRGMTTWELPLGYGRAKPDIMTYGSNVQGSSIEGGCRSLSGTSVSSPVVAGAICLLASTIPESKKKDILNPAAIKQVLIEGAERLPHANMFEQGHGALSLQRSYQILKEYSPRVSIVPAVLDLNDCPYSWPFCSQALYANAMPVVFNATILNGMGVQGRVSKPPRWEPKNEMAKMLDVRFEYSEELWPWSGYLAIYIRVLPEGSEVSGIAEGVVSIEVESPPKRGSPALRTSSATLQLRAKLIPKPPREKRILWDQFHSIKYPPAYLPRDDLSSHNDILDWHGDHPHTNFYTFFDTLRRNGYYLEILGSPLTCFNASEYGALMIVDSEEEFYSEEVSKLSRDVNELGLGLMIFADWFDEGVIRQMRFYDDNTRSWWDAVTGGSNVPALNDLLEPFGAAFAGGSHQLKVSAPDNTEFTMYHGSSLAKMPNDSYVLFAEESRKGKQGKVAPRQVPVLGMSSFGEGRFALFGDSNCLDSAGRKSSCEDFAVSLLQYLIEKDDTMVSGMSLRPDFMGSQDKLPQRPANIDFSKVSRVLQYPLQCYSNSPLEYQGMSYTSYVDSQNEISPTSVDLLDNSSSSGGAKSVSIPETAPFGSSQVDDSIDKSPSVAAEFNEDSGVIGSFHREPRIARVLTNAIVVIFLAGAFVIMVRSLGIFGCGMSPLWYRYRRWRTRLRAS